MVFNATFINIDIILWQLVLLMEYLVVENYKMVFVASLLSTQQYGKRAKTESE
jgi:hypothetical protein